MGSVAASADSQQLALKGSCGSPHGVTAHTTTAYTDAAWHRIAVCKYAAAAASVTAKTHAEPVCVVVCVWCVCVCVCVRAFVCVRARMCVFTPARVRLSVHTTRTEGRWVVEPSFHQAVLCCHADRYRHNSAYIIYLATSVSPHTHTLSLSLSRTHSHTHTHTHTHALTQTLDTSAQRERERGRVARCVEQAHAACCTHACWPSLA